jgi:hypothetical protein
MKKCNKIIGNHIHHIHKDSDEHIVKTKTNIYTIDNLERITDPL